MSARQARIYEMQMRGASAATLADARALDRHISALERDRAAQQRAISARREFLGAAGFSRLGMLLEGGPAAAGVLAGGAIAATAAMIGLGIAGSAVAMKLAADFEQTQVAFRVLIGDAEKADAVLQDIRQFANETPFEFPELAVAAKQLSAYGIAANQLLPTMRMLGEISAAMGVPMSALTDMYGRNRAQQRQYTKDLKEWQNVGVPVLETLAKHFGVTADEIFKMAEEGKLYFGHIQQALIELTEEGGRFAGQTEAQSQTVLGRWSTMKDSITETMRSIGEVLNEGLNVADALQGVSDYFSVLNESIALLRELNKEGEGGFFSGVVAGVTDFLTMLNPFKDALELYRYGQETQKRWDAEAAADKVKPDKVPDLARQEEVDKAAKDAVAMDERMTKDGQRLHEEMRTAKEKYADELLKINELLMAEKIGIEDYNRAREKARQEFEESTPEWKAKQEEEKQRKRDQEKMKQDAESLMEGLRTPQEKFDALVADYERMLGAGAIDQITYDRAVAAAEKDLKGKGAGEQRFAGAAEIGSREWYSALIRGTTDNVAREHLNVDKKNLKEMETLVDLFERVNATPEVTVELL